MRTNRPRVPVGTGGQAGRARVLDNVVVAVSAAARGGVAVCDVDQEQNGAKSGRTGRPRIGPVSPVDHDPGPAGHPGGLPPVQGRSVASQGRVWSVGRNGPEVLALAASESARSAHV